MKAPHEKFLSTEPFCILGPGEKRFYVHGGLLASMSDVFAADVEGGLLESVTKTIQIKDVDGDIDDNTVMRFIEYAYTNDYTVPEPDVLLSATDIALSEKKSEDDQKSSRYQDITEPVDAMSDVNDFSPVYRESEPVDGWGTFGAPMSSKKDKKKKRVRSAQGNHWYEDDGPQDTEPVKTRKSILWAEFQSKVTAEQKQIWSPKSNDDPCEDYSGIFLCHARLYVFSNRYDCEAIMSLSLQRLRATLSKFTLHAKRVHDIVQLIRYTYSHTLDFDQGYDKLKKLVIDYTVCHLEEIMRDDDFKEFLKEAGTAACDLMTQALQRIN